MFNLSYAISKNSLSFSTPIKRLSVFIHATPHDPLPIVKSHIKSFLLVKVFIKYSNNLIGFCVAWTVFDAELKLRILVGHLLPVLLVALFQFGTTAEFGYVMLAYGIIQALDGNLLVPLLFSEAVNLHPVVIIIAVIFFGGLWGFWGVFFAIPLATLVKAVLNAWTSTHQELSTPVV